MTVRLGLAVGAAALALGSAAPAPAQPFGSAGLRIEHAAARLIVIPEARRTVSVSVTVQGGDVRLPRLQTRIEGGVLVVEGGLERRISACEGEGDRSRVVVRGVGPVARNRLPVITARVPMDASVRAGGAVWGEVGPADSLVLSTKGCGDWRVADVRGPLSIAMVGSGDVQAGRAGSAKASVSGSGDVSLTEVGRFEADVTGSGDIRVRRIDGPMNAHVAGSGDITVENGRASSLAAAVAGSGDIRFGGEAGAVAARIAGSGDIRVARASGPVSRSVAGSGEVIVGR